MNIEHKADQRVRITIKDGGQPDEIIHHVDRRHGRVVDC